MCRIEDIKIAAEKRDLLGSVVVRRAGEAGWRHAVVGGGEEEEEEDDEEDAGIFLGWRRLLWHCDDGFCEDSW